MTALLAQVEVLKARVAELEGRLALNSQNSSKPPSADGLNRPKPKSQRLKGMTSTGGQKGHPGHTLKQVAHPDYIQEHRPAERCDVCDRPLPEAVAVEARQVFDIPPLRHEVTEHQVFEARCACGKLHRGEFPAEVAAPVQYGPRIKAAVVHLTHHHMLPLERTGALTGDLFGLPIADATLVAIHEEARELLEPTVAALGEHLKTAPVVHADETGMRVSGKLHWLHVLATSALTWIKSHTNRGKKAFDAFGILAAFIGTLVHDGWKPYRDLACTHALCNAHHVRELTYVFEEMQQTWAKRLIDLLLDACHEVTVAQGVLADERVGYYRLTYAEILAEGEPANPRPPPSGKRGRTKQNQALNPPRPVAYLCRRCVAFCHRSGCAVLQQHRRTGRAYAEGQTESLRWVSYFERARNLLRPAFLPRYPSQTRRQPVPRNDPRLPRPASSAPALLTATP